MAQPRPPAPSAPQAQFVPPSPEARARHEQWLLEVTQIPTAAGRERRVIEWIRRWVAQRSDLRLDADNAGNLVVRPARPWTRRGKKSPPVYITAHLDHPAFVVERIVGPATIELSFRGGVMDAYFKDARIIVHGANDNVIGASITGESGSSSPFGKFYLADLDAPADIGGTDAEHDHEPASAVAVGDVATWALPPAEIDADGILHTNACDDLAALAAAVAAYDELRLARDRGEDTEDVRLLFTRAEEIGFVGALAACRLGTMEKSARVVALENSRSFPESPIGAGPIVRVGDRMSIFTPSLTNACAKRAEEITGKPAQPLATQKQSDVAGRGPEGGFKWQRKLMAGGACEASVFCAYGYQATCLCLPLGNYHNMSNLADVQAGKHDEAHLGPPRVGREYISVADFHSLVALLIAIGTSLPEGDPVMPKLESLYQSKAKVLDEEPVRVAPALGGQTLRAGSGGRAGARAPQRKSKPRRAPAPRPSKPTARKAGPKRAKVPRSRRS